MPVPRSASARPLRPRRRPLALLSVLCLVLLGLAAPSALASGRSWHRHRPPRSTNPPPATTAAPATTTTRAPAAGGTPSASMGLWAPGPHDTCPKALHDSFRTVGPEGKVYPTWHPPTAIDPSTGRTCTFGHEHGLDPAGSNLWPWIQRLEGGLPFGFANQRQLDAGIGEREEDHVGHKVFWRNGVRLQQSPGRADLGVTCDFLVKLHQGTHSPDAFVENAHELAYFVRCSDGTALAATLLSRIGDPGSFVRGCDKQTVIAAGTAGAGAAPGRGVRFIPDAVCAQRDLGAMYEDWITSNYLRTPGGRQLAYFDPNFAVFNPSRYFDPAAPGHLGRTITRCASASSGIARTGECQGAATGAVAFDDPRSPFAGDHREVYFNQTTLTNAGGPTTWYTDAFGAGASTSPFPGSIAQFVAAIDNSGRPTLESQAFGADLRPPAAAGVHAPN